MAELPILPLAEAKGLSEGLRLYGWMNLSRELDEVLCTALGVGLVLVALWPAARGMTAFGWLPLWLVGMPGAAWWAVRGCPVPVVAPSRDAVAVPARVATRRTGPQASRRRRDVARGKLRRAA